MDIKKFKFGIVTYRQPENLKNCYDSIIVNKEIDPAKQVIVINNHTSYVSPGACIEIHNLARSDNSLGNLAQSWNQCIQFGFETAKEEEPQWLVLLQSDVVLKSEWLASFSKLLSYDPEAEFIACGPGDQCVFLKRSGFNKIGWWDERFTGIGYHEFDYFMRAFLFLRDRAHIQGHGGQLCYNFPSDIELIERQLENRSGHSNKLNPQLLGHLKRKWGAKIVENVVECDDRSSRWTKILDDEYGDLNLVPKEYNWYPHFYNNTDMPIDKIYFDHVSLRD